LKNSREKYALILYFTFGLFFTHPEAILLPMRQTSDPDCSTNSNRQTAKERHSYSFGQTLQTMEDCIRIYIE